MKLLNFYVDGKVHLGIKYDSGILDLTELALSTITDIPTNIHEFICVEEDKFKRLMNLEKEYNKFIKSDEVVYAPCITNPEKIICVGLNYRSHSKECKMEIPEYPVLFNKFNNALSAHNQTIKLPETAEKFDYEAELVIVIGKKATNISKEEAKDYIFGYTAGNDFSARDLQMRTGQWLLGKTCDGFAPVGPFLVTADEINPNDLEIKCIVNGEVRQYANTSDMIFDCEEIVSYISHHMTLMPGDIIFTGTPSGVILGYPKGERKWLKKGDRVDVVIQNIGTLTTFM